ncbi:hypothetical protein VNI00_010086 [Paramarasmius palmivorus]|uniref:NodB homology domain-containing protein n=1 Tax=Paramarasmius palmivorus TaxID=297713 RepID=A0AAW0CL49_9AGAR
MREQGMFAGEVGTPRLIKLFKKYGIQTTWFIPGHSLETFPKEMAAVRDAGHEIGLHGYSHENPTALSVQQQADILDYTYKLLTDFNNGIPPKAYFMRDEDRWTKIDYNATASTWMKPLIKGSETGLVQIPGNWYLDDLPPMM